MIKVSFRKGGDKVFYTTLKRSLKSKAWEVPCFTYFFFQQKFELLTDPNNTLIQA